MNYIILEADRREKLIEKVEAKLKEGYRPLGGIMFAEFIYLQAMLKQ